MRRDATLVAAGVLGLEVLSACSREEPKRLEPPIPPPVVEQSAPQPKVAAPVQSRIGSMPLLREMAEPPNGQCSAEAAAQRRVTYSIGSPVRVMTVTLGDSARAFLPWVIELRMTQTVAGVDETESIYARFRADGSLETGTRNFRGPGPPPLHESVPLPPADVGPLKDLALQVIRWCK